MKRVCPVAITECPGVDSPILNLSSEAPDPLYLFGTAYTPFNPYGIPPLGGTTLYIAKDCFGVEFSVLSQEIANLLAQFNAEICQGGNAAIFFANDAQTATARCENGTVFNYTVIAGLFVAPFANPAEGTAWKAAANARALAYAEQKVSDLANQFCISTPTSASPTVGDDQPDRPVVNPPGIVPGMPHLQTVAGWCCLGDTLWPELNTYAVRGQNRLADYTFEIVAGAIPPGTVFFKYDRNRAQLSGFPTAAGTYTFTIRAALTDMPWIYADITDTLNIFGITNPDLDEATVGVAYSYQLQAAGGTLPITFTLLSSLPPGLTMDDTGLISGTPT